MNFFVLPTFLQFFQPSTNRIDFPISLFFFFLLFIEVASSQRNFANSLGLFVNLNDYSLITQSGSSRRSPASATILQSDRPTKWSFARSRDKFAEKRGSVIWRPGLSLVAGVDAALLPSPCRGSGLDPPLPFFGPLVRNFAKRASRNLALVALRVSSRRGKPAGADRLEE